MYIILINIYQKNMYTKEFIFSWKNVLFFFFGRGRRDTGHLPELLLQQIMLMGLELQVGPELF